MKLILIRHGESQANAGNVAPKNNLTKRGWEQAEQLAEELKEEKIDQIYCSNTERCLETMEAILGRRNEEINICLSKLISPKIKTEDYNKLQKRIRRFIDDLKIEFEKETVAIVSHQLVLGMFIYELTGKTERLGNGEIRKIDL